MTKQSRVFVVFAIPFALAVPSGAQPIENPNNNHYYELIEGDFLNWEEARADAATRSFNGWTGHLVTITDASEEAFLIDNFPDSSWLGGTDEGQEGHWYWITGEAWSYENWEPGEPNNYDGDENCLERESSTQWNDMPCDDYSPGRWIVEYGESLSGPGTFRGSEISVVHLVLEKPTKMKKVEAALFMSCLNQSLKGDKPHDLRRLGCLVTAKGKNGSLKTKGKLLLRLLGRRLTTSTAWQSRAAVMPLNKAGGADFGVQAILDLISDATAIGVEPEVFEITFDGGKGKKVTELTIDCLHKSVQD